MTQTHADLFLLLGGVMLVLVLASVVAVLLRTYVAPHRGDDVIENYVARIESWWAMVILLSIAFLIGKAGVILLFAFVSFAALREFLTLTTKSRADHYALLAAFFLVLPIQYWLIYIDWYGLYSIFIPVYAFLFMPIASLRRGDTESFLFRVAETQWALMICIFCASHVPALLTLDIPGFEGREVLLIAFLIFVAQFSDVMQYLWDRLFGKTLIAPAISSRKTWEGTVTGIATGTLAGALLWWLTPFSPGQAFLMSLAISVMGFFGGLVMSAIKRDKGVKDWGHLIQGHGGFIDRLDSVVFSAPIFFHLTRYFFT